MHGVTNLNQEQALAPRVLVEDGVFFSPSETCTDEIEEIIITNIRAMDVALGLGRIPADFYAMVHHNGIPWRTENKRSTIYNDVVEWTEPIPIPSDSSTTLQLEVYRSYELKPMIRSGEQLRRLALTVEKLLNYSERDVPFTLFSRDGDVVSLCSPIAINVKRQTCKSGDLSTSTVPGPHSSTTESRSEPANATNQGHGILLCYQKWGKRQDLEHSIEQFERALSLCPVGHPCHTVAQSNLAVAKFILCQGENTNSLFPLSLCNALRARPVGHIDHPAILIYLATVHPVRLKMLGHEGARAEVLLHEVIELGHADSHENRGVTLMLRLHARRRVGPAQWNGQSTVDQNSTSNLMGGDPRTLSAQLLQRFERSGDLDDLEQAIASLQGLAKSTPIWDTQYHAILGNLGLALLLRFERRGELSDLEDAVSTLRAAFEFTPETDPDKSAALNGLGKSLFARFERFGELKNLEDALLAHKVAVDLTPDNHTRKPNHLNDLGSSFATRFRCLGELRDLEDAISVFKDAFDLIPHGHLREYSYLNNLGNAFFARFGRVGELKDLEDAISTHKAAVGLIPYGHPHKPVCLSNLGTSLISRFARLGALSDLEDAISTQKAAVDLTPSGHPAKPVYLNSLGDTLFIRFERFGEVKDMEGAISTHKAAVKFTPHGHPNKHCYLNALGNSYITRFKRFGELNDLENAISSYKAALDLIPYSHPEKPVLVSNLGNSLTARFERLGDLKDLEDAISAQGAAVNLTPDGHPDKPRHLGSLGNSLRIRFMHLGDSGDLENSIFMLKASVSLTPHGHIAKPLYLSNLGNCFITRFQRLGESNDLEDAILTYKAAVNLIPDDHPEKANCVNCLGCSFSIRFTHLGEIRDLEDAISAYKAAVDLTPHGHLTKPSCLGNLGNSFLTRFGIFGELKDLEDAISTHKAAVALAPFDHPHKPIHLHHLGNSFQTRFAVLGDPSDLENAISAYSHAASSPLGPVDVRFLASKKWIACARSIHHHSLLHAYSVAVDLLPHLAWIGFSLSQRYSQLAWGADVVREAVATALDSGFPEAAVEWLEQGRAVVWGELFQLRSSYEELSSAHPDYADRLRELSTALDHASATREQPLPAHPDGTQSVAYHTPEFLRPEVDRHRRLAIERDRLLQKIRRLPGFEKFLLRKDFSQLRTSARSGPVVILNAAESRCDALIVLANVGHVIHVPLPNFSYRQSVSLQKILKSFVRQAREGRSVPGEGVSWETFLSPLWQSVVKPVLNALAFSTPGDSSRMFWCATGPFAFLPLHAAGFYGAEYSDPGHKVSDFVVSSYVPTLSILSSSPPPNPDVVRSGNIHLLLVPQPKSDGQSRLPGVVTELTHIRELIQDSPSARITAVESSVGSVEEVLSLMKDADWVHFACHGIQAHVDSGLCLADQRRLNLRDIIRLSRPRGGLAFLSACQTAMGESHLPDEAIHISAGMLYAGYGGVIGTMWSISDRLAPVVAGEVYARLFGNGRMPDYRDAARALHEAIGYVRDRGAPFEEWIPFIHVGV